MTSSTLAQNRGMLEIKRDCLINHAATLRSARELKVDRSINAGEKPQQKLLALSSPFQISLEHATATTLVRAATVITEKRRIQFIRALDRVFNDARRKWRFEKAIGRQSWSFG